MADTSRLPALLIDPNESPEVEFKSLLDFSDQEQRGVLARAVIALVKARLMDTLWTFPTSFPYTLSHERESLDTALTRPGER